MAKKFQTCMTHKEYVICCHLAPQAGQSFYLSAEIIQHGLKGFAHYVQQTVNVS